MAKGVAKSQGKTFHEILYGPARPVADSLRDWGTSREEKVRFERAPTNDNPLGETVMNEHGVYAGEGRIGFPFKDLCANCNRPVDVGLRHCSAHCAWTEISSLRPIVRSGGLCLSCGGKSPANQFFCSVQCSEKAVIRPKEQIKRFPWRNKDVPVCLPEDDSEPPRRAEAERDPEAAYLEVVYLDTGEVIPDVFMYDLDEGVAWQYVRDDRGVLLTEGSGLKMRAVRGDIEARWKTS